MYIGHFFFNNLFFSPSTSTEKSNYESKLQDNRKIKTIKINKSGQTKRFVARQAHFKPDLYSVV